MAKKIKSSEDELAELYDVQGSQTTIGNNSALEDEFNTMREKFNEEYYKNKNQKKARQIEEDYDSKTLEPMRNDLIKQKKADELKRNSKFSGLKKLLRGE
jgi:hypothetical protein